MTEQEESQKKQAEKATRGKSYEFLEHVGDLAGGVRIGQAAHVAGHLAASRLIVNFAGEKEDQFAGTAAVLEEADGIDALEMNLSCPNVKEGGRTFGADPGAVRRKPRHRRRVADRARVHIRLRNRVARRAGHRRPWRQITRRTRLVIRLVITDRDRTREAVQDHGDRRVSAVFRQVAGFGHRRKYTGQALTWQEAMESPMALTPTAYAWDADPPEARVAIPGLA